MKTDSLHPDLVTAYLKNIGRVPLLTHEQEVQYGKAVQKLMALEDIKANLTDTFGDIPSLSEWANAADMTPEALQKSVNAGQRAKRKMVEANLRLVVSIAKKYIKRNVDLMDLIQEGNIGLQRGVEKFDPAKGYRLSTYTYWWIRQAITRAIAEKSRVIRLPIHIHEKLNKVKQVQRQLSQQLGRVATVNEIADSLDLTVEKVRSYLSYSRPPLSLDLRVGDNQDTELAELIEDMDASPEDYVTQTTINSDISKMLDTLTPQEKEVISLHFGLEDGNKMSFVKIGDRLNMNREKVRQIEKSAFKRLREQCGTMRSHLAAV
ncbi:MAG: RNA polymerase sigma factor, RpoD/SigA family [Cyanobacteria bacterium P01_F01_bin.150]